MPRPASENRAQRVAPAAAFDANCPLLAIVLERDAKLAQARASAHMRLRAHLKNRGREAETDALFRRLYQEVLITFQELGDKRNVAAILHALATIAQGQGDQDHEPKEAGADGDLGDAARAVAGEGGGRLVRVII